MVPSVLFFQSQKTVSWFSLITLGSLIMWKSSGAGWFMVMKNFYVYRKQFPLILAYAVTIHVNIRVCHWIVPLQPSFQCQNGLCSTIQGSITFRGVPYGTPFVPKIPSLQACYKNDTSCKITKSRVCKNSCRACVKAAMLFACARSRWSHR